MNGVPFDVKVYMKAVKSYLNGRKSVEEIVQKAGISQSAFSNNKLREYRTTGRIGKPQTHPIKGPKALKRTREFNTVLRGAEAETSGLREDEAQEGAGEEGLQGLE